MLMSPIQEKKVNSEIKAYTSLLSMRKFSTKQKITTAIDFFSSVAAGNYTYIKRVILMSSIQFLVNSEIEAYT